MTARKQQAPQGPDTPDGWAIEIDESTDEAYWASVRKAEAFFSSRERSDDVMRRLARIADSHRDWPIRAAAVAALAAMFPGHEEARRAVARATHDDVDWVAFSAIRIVGQLRWAEAAADLIRISGWPSRFTRPRYPRKPVGCGAAFTKRSLLQIFGSSDPRELRRLEDAHFAPLREKIAARRRPRRNPDVVWVSPGAATLGIERGEVGPFQMDEADNPVRTVELPGFYLDRTTVTNARYQEFLNEVGDDPAFDHPDQPLRRDHRPSHRHDPRFNAPGLPVVGIDWYDAWAFANWAGGRLPTEEEWEKAARGGDARLFPWGDGWDPERANYVGRSFGKSVGSLAELEELLVSTSDCYPPCPVLPADALPESASPCGALQMAGNVWEMTATNYYSRRHMDPFFRGREPSEFMNRRDAFFVLRGGTWTSPPVCLMTCYRGKDLITDRHNEVGFRCAYDAEDAGHAEA